MQRRFTLVVSLLVSIVANAQLPSSSFSYSCLKDTVIECGPRCTTLKTQIPNIKSLADNYVVNKTCFKVPVSPAQPGTSVNFDVDDEYSSSIFLPFVFPFYGNYYSELVAGSNGTVSFDITNAGGFADWAISGNLPSTNYDKALIMFPFQDVDITQTTSPTRQIKIDIVGTAPHRKWVITYDKIPLYVCSTFVDNTYQLALHESTGLIEVFVKSRQSCSAWNGGKGIIGMQDFTQTKGIMTPGRTATDANWGSVDMNEAWRFTPSGGQPLLKKTELYSINGNFITNGDTADAGNGIYNVSFDNVCIDSTSDYVVKSSYYNCLYFLDPPSFSGSDSIVYATDTIHVLKANIVPQLSVINADCSQGNPNTGSITIVQPTGPGYVYSLNNSAFSTSPLMPNLSQGIYDITIMSPAGCVFIVRDTVELVNGAVITLDYTKHTYCNTEASPPLPTTSVGGGAENFRVYPNGLIIDNATGQITIPGSATGSYTVTCDLYNPFPCWPSSISTIVRIADNSTFIWTGASSNAWENAANWSCNNLPTSTSNVFIYEGNVVINSNVTVNSLSVAPGASVTVSPGMNLTVLHP